MQRKWDRTVVHISLARAIRPQPAAPAMDNSLSCQTQDMISSPVPRFIDANSTPVTLCQNRPAGQPTSAYQAFCVIMHFVTCLRVHLIMSHWGTVFIKFMPWFDV